MQTTTRNANLADLAKLLQDQHGRKLDVVAPAKDIKAVDGKLRIQGTDIEVDPVQGVRPSAALFTPTAVADEGIAQKLGVPMQYLKRIRDERPDLYDANVNGWLHGEQSLISHDFEPRFGPDQRNFLVRCFKGDDGENGIARAFLSERYSIVDNLDVLTAVLEGVEAAGVNVNITGCDLTDRRMYVRISAPEVQTYANGLLDGYRNPFQGGAIQRAGGSHYETDAIGQDPGTVVNAGLFFSNSEVGNGAFSLTPRIEVVRCRNGLVVTQDVARSIHLGGKMDEGIIKWEADTERNNLELVSAKTRDAVKTFLDVEYMQAVIARLEQQAGKEVSDPMETVKLIGSQLRFTEDQTKGILNHFIKGGQGTAAGVLNAVTSYAQTVEDADEAFGIEGLAVKAFELAAK